MRLGVDFGTTRIVVAAADRGNYPVVSFDRSDGDHQDWIPPLVAFGVRSGALDGTPGIAKPSRVDGRAQPEAVAGAGRSRFADRNGRRDVWVLALLVEIFEYLRVQIIEHSSLRG